jgi:hypothetical protein
MAYRIDVDAAAFNISLADDNDIDGETTFATLAEAKAEALAQAIPERDAWAQCVRDIRGTTVSFDVRGRRR